MEENLEACGVAAFGFFPVSVGGGRPGVDDDDDVGERRSLSAINEEI